MSRDLHMKMDDDLATDIQTWADRHHASFTAAVSVLCSQSLYGPRALDPSITLHSAAEVAARILSCSEMHVSRLIAAGELATVNIATPGAGRSKTRIRSDNLAAYIERQTVEREAGT